MSEKPELRDIEKTVSRLKREIAKRERILRTWPYSEKNRLLKEAELSGIRLDLSQWQLILEDAAISDELTRHFERMEKINEMVEAENAVIEDLKQRRTRLTRDVEEMSTVLSEQLSESS